MYIYIRFILKPNSIRLDIYMSTEIMMIPASIKLRIIYSSCSHINAGSLPNILHIVTRLCSNVCSYLFLCRLGWLVEPTCIPTCRDSDGVQMERPTANGKFVLKT